MEEETRIELETEELETVDDGLTQDSEPDVAATDATFEMDDDEFSAMVGTREYESSADIEQLWMREIGAVPLLSNKEVVELARVVEEGEVLNEIEYAFMQEKGVAPDGPHFALALLNRTISLDREVAVIALGGIVVSRSIRVAGDELDEEIIRYAREKYNLLVGERMAEKAKMAIGSAYPLEQEQTMLLRGRNLLTGLPQSVEVSSVEIREAISGPIHIITEAVRNTLDETPPELVADLMEHGIALVGGGALVQGLAQRLSEETRMKVTVADEPLTCVAKGAGRVLGELDALRKVLSAAHRDGRWG